MSSIKHRTFIEAILLAAGASRRFGHTKQLALINGTPMLVRTIGMLTSADFDAITIVLGANAKVIKQNLEDATSPISNDIDQLNKKHINTVIAENWSLGMGASIATGIKNLHLNTTHVFVALSDQVEIRAQQCNLMIESSLNNPDNIVAAFYQGKLGAPAIFPKAYFSELAMLNDDKGARNILRQNVDNVISINMPEAAKDIDTKQDLARYQQTSIN